MRVKNRLKFIVLATLVGLIASLFYNAVPQKVEAKTMYTNLYAQDGIDTTSLGKYYLTPNQLYSLKFLDSNKYEIKGRWNKYITEWDKLELKNFSPKIPTGATINAVYLHGIWSKDDKEIEDAWITIHKPGEAYVKHLPIPAPGVNSHVLINLTSFFPTANDINNAYIWFQAKSKSVWKKAKTWHEQFKINVKYDDHLDKPTVIDGDTPPDDIDWIKPNPDDTLTISANWSGFGSSVDFYKVCAGTVLNETHTACHGDYPNNGTQNIVPQTPTSFTSGSINIPSPPNGTKYYVYVKAFYKDKSTFTLAHSDGVTVDSEGPTVNITSPISGSTLNKNIQILADADDGAGIGIEKVGFAYLNDIDEYVDKDGNLIIDPANPFFAVDDNGSDGWSTIIDSTQLSDGPYKVAAVGFDLLGNSDMDKVNFSVDNTPPDNPSVIGTPGDGEATLTWNAVSDAVYYNIFRGGVLIAGHYTDLVFKDSGLTNDNKYQYRITAVDALGNESTGTIINVTPVSATLGAILATATFRPTGAVAGVALAPEEEEPGIVVEPGKVLAEETKESPKAKEKAPYWGWLYLLIIFILILVGYYYYYLKDEYTQWYWVFPLIVAMLLWFINRSLSKVFEGGLAAQLFWLWELIVLLLFAIFYSFWGAPSAEKTVAKKFRKK